MSRGRTVIFLTLALALAVFLGACGNPLEGGSDPSGSILRVTNTSLNTCGGDCTSAQQDIFFCEGEGVTYATMQVEILNDSRPNTPTDSNTNSFVSINRYRVDYAVLNMSATLPGLDGGGFSVGIAQDETGTVDVLLITEATLEHIRSNFPQVGNGDSMTVRADVVIWGEDAFQVDVNAHASATLVIDDFNPCLSDIPPPDESSE